MFLSSLIMWLFFGGFSAYLARRQGKNPFLWFFLGMFFGLFGLVFLLFSPKPAKARRRAQRQKEEPTTIDITPKVDPSHKNKFWYYLDPENRQNGPMSFDALVRDWKEGKVGPKTYVWNENLEEWEPWGDFIENPSPIN